MKTIFLIFVLALNLFFLPKSLWADGIVYGTDHAFSFETPSGWVLDTKSGAHQGLHAVFYPQGYSWENSPVIMYARGITRTNKHKEISDFVNETLTSMKLQSPNVTATLYKRIELNSGKKAEIYSYENDRWGNKELVAYFLEKLTINFLVLSARTEFAFNKAEEPFLFIVNSYNFITEKVEIKRKE